jgi:hypothetical protein
MGKLAIWAQLEAKPGKEKEVEEFLKSAQPLAEREEGTITWYAIKMGPGKYGHLRHLCRRKWPKLSPQRGNRKSAICQGEGPARQTTGDCKA